MGEGFEAVKHLFVTINQDKNKTFLDYFISMS